jgi:putative transposase
VNSRKKTILARDFARGHPHLNKSHIARQFGIARGTLYLTSKQKEKDRALLTLILAVRDEHPHYGHKRIALQLEKSKNAVLRIMRRYGLRPKKRRRKPKYQAKSMIHNIPNRLKETAVAHPNHVWAGDFTYFSYYGTYFYLATVIDIFTREILGWSIGRHHSADLVLEAIAEAKRRRDTKTPLIFHSDQGSEYDSEKFMVWLMAHNVLPSHSAKAHPWENGFQESFYANFKMELGSLGQFAGAEDMIAAIHQQIHYYNTERIHSKLKMPPAEYMRRISAERENPSAA